MCLDTNVSTIEKVTVEKILGHIPSGIGLDVAKNHTGIVIWDGTQTLEFGFDISEYDKDDYFAEYKMRRDFKKKLKEIVEGKHFEICIIEDVYLGENFSTVRKLLALQTVIDELIFERVCTVGKFVRWNEPQWMSMTRLIYKTRGRLKSKIENQTILEYLEYDFYMKNKDLSEADKKKIYFEDICDACGMLLGVVMAEIFELNLAKSPSLHLSDIKMVYVEDLEDTYTAKDIRVREEPYRTVDLNMRNLKSSIVNAVKVYPDDVLCAYVPVDKLGTFGIQHKFTFFESGEGYLLFYKR